MQIPEFTDLRQVAVYDTVNSYASGTPPDFYLGVAEEIGAEVVIAQDQPKPHASSHPRTPEPERTSWCYHQADRVRSLTLTQRQLIQ